MRSSSRIKRRLPCRLSLLRVRVHATEYIWSMYRLRSMAYAVCSHSTSQVRSMLYLIHGNAPSTEMTPPHPCARLITSSLLRSWNPRFILYVRILRMSVLHTACYILLYYSTTLLSTYRIGSHTLYSTPYTHFTTRTGTTDPETPSSPAKITDSVLSEKFFPILFLLALIHPVHYLPLFLTGFLPRPGVDSLGHFSLFTNSVLRT